MKAKENKALPPEAYDRVPRLQLTLTDETVWLTRFDAKGRPGLTYPVSAAGVARAFNVFGASTGLLPQDTLFWQQAGSEMRLGIYLPPCVRSLAFAGGKRATRLTVPLPGFIFVGQGLRYHIFAALRRPASANETLYNAPLPNVYEDGSICTGDVKFPRCAPHTLAAAVTAFFESDFTLHLENDRVQARGSLLTFLRGLQGKQKFPGDRLIPSGLTMGRLIDGERRRERIPQAGLRGAVVLDPDLPAPDLGQNAARVLMEAREDRERTDTWLDDVDDEEELEVAL